MPRASWLVRLALSVSSGFGCASKKYSGRAIKDDSWHKNLEPLQAYAHLLVRVCVGVFTHTHTHTERERERDRETERERENKTLFFVL